MYIECEVGLLRIVEKHEDTSTNKIKNLYSDLICSLQLNLSSCKLTIGCKTEFMKQYALSLIPIKLRLNLNRRDGKSTHHLDLARTFEQTVHPMT